MLKKAFVIQNNHNNCHFQWQPKTAQFLAVGDQHVTLYDRQGSIFTTIQLTGESKQLQWSPSGTHLAILQNKSTDIIIWEQNKGTTTVETSLKNLESIVWSPDEEFLSAVSSKGNIYIYEMKTGKRIPIYGKHAKAINSSSWSFTNKLACSSADKTLTISNQLGDTLNQIQLTGEPSMIKWFMGGPEQETEILTVVSNKKSILIFFELNKPPIELSLKYDVIKEYYWCDNETILIAFVSGTIVSVSTKPETLGQELYQSKIFKESLRDFTISSALRNTVGCGDYEVKIQDLNNLQDMSCIFTIDEGKSIPLSVVFSDDGQFLTVYTKDHKIHTYLSKSPTLNGVWNDRIAFLKNLNEVTINDYSKKAVETVTTSISIEPERVSMGPNYMVVSNNEWCFYYPVLPNVEISSDQLEYVYGKKDNTSIPLEFRKIQNKTPYFEKRYAEAICKVELNEKYAMLLTKTGKVYLHPINDQYFSDPNGHIMMFPETFNNSEPEYTITDATLTNYFLVFSTDTGKILHYDLEEFLMINEFNNANPIHKLVHQPGIGNKLIFIDSNYNAFITSPLSDVSILIPSWTKNFKGALWETNPQPGINVFVAWTESSIFTFSFNSMTLKGPQCYQVSLGPTHLPYGFNPIYFSQGRLICQSLSGKMETVVLNSHKSYTPEKFLTVFPTEAEQGAALKLLYVVGKKEVLWSLYPTVKSSTAWLMLAEALLKSLEVKAAKRIYRQILGDVGMVMNLERIEVVEERIELLGHIAVLFEDFNLAQQCFLNSSQPKEALYLRMDLLDWEQALHLATKFAPEELSTICYEYACQYEMDGKYGEAHTKYEQAIQAFKEYNQNNSELADHGFLCEAGLIRMTMAVGDLPKGMAMLSEVTNKTLLEDCVEILESLKQYSEAGILLERAGLWERAAECWIKFKNWNRLGNLLEKVTNPKIFIQYGKAKEAEGQYAEAAGAYERAQDYDSVIRILVDQLHDIEGGAILVRKTQARESAKQLAAIFLKERNFEATIEFYLIAGLQSQAFELAKQQDYMVYFGSLVKDEASTDLLSDIAQYFEFKGNYLEAGKYHLHALHYSEALKMFLQCPVLDGTPIDLAINTIGEAKNDSLTHELIDYLMGERDGVPKDAKYIFKLYMSLGQFKEAARTAVIIAREEQVLGNYRAAHDLLFDNYRQLKLTGASIPAELNRMLMLIHSYILVKTLVRIDEHLLGAQMLMRVSNHISKFPAHIVPILTSTVIECHRAGLKKEAFDYASMLMRPEYRQKVDAKFKRKIEQIIRRPEKEEVQPNYTPCPYCDAPVMETSLDCTECKSNIPYCIATGHHMVLNNWSMCPNCEFPALASQFKNLIERTNNCPMCGFDLIVEDIRIIEHPLEKVPKYDESASEIVRKETNFGTGGLAA